MNKKIIMPFFISAFLFGLCSAQSVTPEVIATQGDYSASADGSVSWTLGELMGETYNSPGNSITQGFQQPSFNLTTGLNKMEAANAVSVFPNPATDKLTLNFAKALFGNYCVDIFDMQGKKISSEIFNLANGVNAHHIFSFGDYPAGIYLLNISCSENNFKQSLRVSKTN